MKLTSAAQMREMDRQTIEDYGVPSVVLMENAALRVVEVMAERYAPLKGQRIAVVCGKGNNGGDGFAVARHLANRCGAEVAVWLLADPATLKGDAKINYWLAQKFGLEINEAGGEIPPGFATVLARTDIIIDALLGTGVRGAVTGALAEAIGIINLSPAAVIAVDVPSGLDADTGATPGACVKAALTVTFALPKYGLVEFPGVDSVGELVVADIGMPRPVMEAAHVQTWQTDAADMSRWLPSRDESRDSNKGKFGHVFVFAGSQGFVGAPTLTAEGAARTGAGLVTLVVPQGLQDSVMCRVSPVVMTRGLPETAQGAFSQEALEDALHLAEKADAVALGPGLGGVASEPTRAFVKQFVARCPGPLVVDADALNILAAESDHGAAILQSRSAPTVLTPHPGEMGRLLGLGTKDVQADRHGAVARAVSMFGCVVLLKGARTLVADPTGALYVNTTGNSGMASGGMGDTLTGIIAALLAGHVPPTQAAAAGAYLHGLAGDLAAAGHGGKAGLLATDIIEWLPRALARCAEEAS